MGRGTPLTSFRFEPELRSKVTSVILRRNKIRKNQKYSLSDFIRDAISEKLQHIERSKKRQSPVFVTCYRCNEITTRENIGWQRTLLTGGVEYCCTSCDLLKPVSLSPPG